MANITRKRAKVLEEIKRLETLIIEMERKKGSKKNTKILMNYYERRLNLIDLYKSLEHKYPVPDSEKRALYEIETQLNRKFVHLKDATKDNNLVFRNHQEGIIEIVIKNCDISVLPESIFKFKFLRKLALINNNLTILPESISKLSNLKELNLNKNFIKRLPESIGQLKFLEILVLSNNQLTYLPDSFSDLSSLTQLYLDNNCLAVFPEQISYFELLSLLDLANNQIAELPEVMLNLKSLTYLYIVGNPLSGKMGPNTKKVLDKIDQNFKLMHNYNN